jgi:hypothetical protein
MRTRLLTLCLLSFCLIAAAGNDISPNITRPVVFTPNKGQILDQNGEPVPMVLAKTSVPGLDVYITQKGITYVFLQYETDASAASHPVFKQQQGVKVHYSRVDVDLAGAQINPAQVHFGQQQALTEAFYKNKLQIENIPNYQTLTISNVYPGIDWVWHTAAAGQPEYDFIVHPGASPAAIKMQYKYADVSPRGNILKVACHNGTLLEGELKAASGKTAVEVTYNFNKANNTVGFVTGNYNTATDLVIDPPIALQWSNQFGGAFAAGFRGVAADSLGNTYYAGYTNSAAFPTHHVGGAAYIDSTFNGVTDVLLLKLSPTNVMLWCTYLGGSGNDYGNSLTLDASGNLFVTGFASPGFPTVVQSNAYNDNSANGLGDVFVCRFDVNLRLKWSTFYGGNGNDEALKIATGYNNNIYLTGYTNSGGAFFPSVGLSNLNANSNSGWANAFIAQFNTNCALVFSNCVGSNTGDYYGTGLAMNANGNYWLTGYTTDTLFRYNSLPQHSAGGVDGFVFDMAYYNNYTNAWLYGGAANDYIVDAATGYNENLVFTGRTNSLNLPLHASGGFRYNQSTKAGDYDAFIAQYNSDTLQWSTYYGGSGGDAGTGIAMDSTGNIFLSGFTFSQNMPLDSPLYAGGYYQRTNKGNSDGFLAAFTNHGAQFWGTYKGDSCFEYPADIALTPNGSKLYVCGEGLFSCNQSGPPQSPYQGGGSGVVDGFTWAFSSPSRYCSGLSLSGLQPTCPNAGCNGHATIAPAGGVPPYSVFWSNGIHSLQNNTLCNGTNWVQVRDSAGCVGEASFNLEEFSVQDITSPKTCFDTGLAQVFIRGGVRPYHVLWNTGDTTQYISADTGHYSVTITDSMGCIINRSMQVGTADVLNIEAVELQSAHCVSSDGIAEAYSYGSPIPSNWYDEFGNFIDYTDVLYNLAPGIYYTDSVNCINMQIVPDTVVIYYDSTMIGVTLDLTIGPGSCTTNTGDISLSISGNQYPLYSYTWSDGYFTTLLFDDTHAVQANELITVTVTDIYNCTVSASGTVVINYPYDSGSYATDAACANSETGTLQGYTDGGSGNYQYEWSDFSGSYYYTGQTANNVAPGNYTLTITDLNTSCTVGTNLLVNYQGSQYMQLNTLNNHCQPNGSGSIWISQLYPPLYNGNNHYTYHWADNNGHVYPDSVAIKDLRSGYYYVTVTNSYGFSVSACVLVNDDFLNTLDISIDSIGYNCSQGTHLQLHNFLPPYNTYWSNGITGNAEIYVSDTGLVKAYVEYNGCWDTASYRIVKPAGFTAAYTATPIACNGGTSVVTISGNGGFLPYSGDTGVHIVPAGSYNYTINDSSGCSTSLHINIVQPSPLSISAQFAPIACYGGTTIVSVNGSGGTPPYTGALSAAYGPGIYTFTITDSKGCTASDTITLTEPPALQADYSADNITCFGGTTTVSITATGGTMPYSGTGNQLVAAGTYNWVVSDALGCKDTVSGTVTQHSQIIPSYTATPVLCYGQSSAVTITATSGLAPYTGIGQQQFAAGNYTVTVIDKLGCQADLDIAITQPTLLVASASGIPIACNSANTTITVTASGGTLPYSGDTGQYLAPAGTYIYNITDSNGCTASDTLEVTQPQALQAAYTATPITCYGQNAVVQISATGGTQPYNGTGQQLYAAGNYNVVVSDAGGCTDTLAIEITQPAELQVAYTASAINCFGGTATVDVTASGGVSPYTGTGQQLTAAGNYVYVVTDNNGCTDSVTVNISQPAQLDITATVTNANCFGDSGTVVLSATGGTPVYTYPNGNGGIVPAGNYTYIVVDSHTCADTVQLTVTAPDQLVAAYTTPGIACYGQNAVVQISATGGTQPYNGTGQQLYAAGNYNVVVSDAGGCTDTLAIEITQPAELQVAYTASAINCFGGTATVDVTASGGVSPYTGTGQQLTAAGNYVYVVTDNNSCTDSVTVNISQPAQLDITATVTNANCFGDSGTVVLNSMGGTPAYTYPNGNGGIVPAGNYTYIVVDSHTCTDTVQLTVTSPGAIQFAVQLPATYYCDRDSVPVTITAAGGAAPYQATGNYQLLKNTPYHWIVTDNNGCAADSTFTLNVPAEDISILGPASVCKNSQVHLTATGNYQLQWNGTVNDTAINLTNIQASTTVTVTGRDNNNSCLVADTFTVGVTICTGVGELLSANNISVFPNPNSGYFWVQFTTAPETEAAMRLYAADGKLVLMQPIPAGTATASFNCSQFADGVYILQIMAGDHTYYHKLVIDK